MRRASRARPAGLLVRGSELSGDYRELDGAGGIVVEHNVMDARIPDARQSVYISLRNDDEPVRAQQWFRDFIEGFAIHQDDAILVQGGFFNH